MRACVRACVCTCVYEPEGTSYVSPCILDQWVSVRNAGNVIIQAITEAWKRAIFAARPVIGSPFHFLICLIKSDTMKGAPRLNRASQWLSNPIGVLS